jgi:tetratricopeptide (TPR) repeat protein
MQGCIMAKDGLVRMLCAATLVAAFGGLAALRASNPDSNGVSGVLEIQAAVEQGRDFLQRGDARAAVRLLESRLAECNGDRSYLNLLRDAYRMLIAQLRQANQPAEAQRYLQRLQVLDPGAPLDFPPNRNPAPLASHGKPEAKIRLVGQDEDHPPRKPASTDASSLLARADEAFGRRHYIEAGKLYQQAHQADPQSTKQCRDRWAYSRLYTVVEQVKASGSSGPNWLELEGEVRQALELAPQLAAQFQNTSAVQTIFAEASKRRNGAAAPRLEASTPGQPIPLKHFPRGNDGWARVETANFRIFHNQPQHLAEQVAQAAERTRQEMSLKWFGNLGPDWNPRCDLYLHASASEYSRSTGVPSNSPGHSTIRNEGSRILGRRIDLHCGDPQTMLQAVLPHETTHVVLAGRVGDQPVPRWADEGMAVLSEPRDRIDRHLRNLPRCRQENSLFTVRQLLTMVDYPEPRYITGFYAQSVSLVEYLSGLKGPQVFTQFLRDALRVGPEQSLASHYGLRNFEELQQRWNERAFAPAGSGGVAQRAP